MGDDVQYQARSCALVIRDDRRTVRGPEEVVQVFADLVDAGERREFFVGVYLDSRSHVLAAEVLSIGSLNASIVHPREVYVPAIRQSAASFILAHNHPSGDPTPSEEDIAITRRLHEGGRLLGIELLDHVVVGAGGSYVSLRDRKLGGLR
jgi:DNA repair protein RadC